MHKRKHSHWDWRETAGHVYKTNPALGMSRTSYGTPKKKRKVPSCVYSLKSVSVLPDKCVLPIGFSFLTLLINFTIKSSHLFLQSFGSQFFPGSKISSVFVKCEL